MKLDYVTIEKRGGIAVVRFDRKANLNAFNEKLVVELTHAARHLSGLLRLRSRPHCQAQGFAALMYAAGTPSLSATVARSQCIRPRMWSMLLRASMDIRAHPRLS